MWSLEWQLWCRAKHDRRSPASLAVPDTANLVEFCQLVMVAMTVSSGLIELCAPENPGAPWVSATSRPIEVSVRSMATNSWGY